MSRLNKVIAISMVSCVCVYTVVAYAGYFTYGDKCETDILNNYPETVVVALVRIGLSIAVAFSYPLQCHPCRRCLSSLIWTKDTDDLSNVQFYGLTYAIWVGSFVISLIVHDLGVVLALVGATGSTTISYILPGLFYYRSFETQVFDKKRYLALFMVGMGCILIPFAVTVQFI